MSKTNIMDVGFTKLDYVKENIQEWKYYIYCFLNCLCNVFCYIEPIGILSLFVPFFYVACVMDIQHVETTPNARSRTIKYAVLIISNALGQSLAMNGYLGYIIVLIISLFSSMIFILFVWIWHKTFKRYDWNGWTILGYPIMCTSYYIILGFTPLSSITNISYSLWYLFDLIQIASLFGSYFVTFLHFWFGITLYLSVKNYNKKSIKYNLFAFICTIFIVFIYGGFRNGARYFYHRNQVNMYSPDDAFPKNVYINYGCITDISQFYNPYNNKYKNVMDLDIILTNEGYQYQSSSNKYLINYAAKISKDYKKDVLLGIGNINNCDNCFDLYQIASGNASTTLLFRYNKGNPVPFREHFKRRTQKPPTAQVTFSKTTFTISSLICFDIFFTFWSIVKADIILHPSFYWNSWYNQLINIKSFRAIENAYTILHCSKNGNTAVIDDHGTIQYKEQNDQISTFPHSRISIHKTKSTAYSTFGFLFNYTILCLAGIVLISGILYPSISKVTSNDKPQSQMELVPERIS